MPSRCVCMHIVPSFTSAKAVPDADGNLVDNPDIVELMDNVKSEMIFIIDRSGSMDGERITIAKKALILSLRSLPYDSFFNIVSFGSSFNFMHIKSVKADQHTIEAAIKKINTFGADMGGTEILAPLMASFNAPALINYQKNIFLLTDGSVSNADLVIKETKQHCSGNRSRVFTIGIGNGVSDHFIQGVAAAGNGSHDVIHDLTIMEDRVISMLQGSYSPSLTNFRIEFDATKIEAMAPALSAESHILKDKPL